MPNFEYEAELSPSGLGTLPVRVRSAVLAGLLILAVFYTGFFAAPIIVPIVGAVLLNFLFSPVVTAGARRGIPRIAGAAGVVGSLGALVAFSLYWLAGTQPDKRAKVEGRIRNIRGGKLSTAKWGERMQGRGQIADQIKNLFQICARKYGLNKKLPPLDTSQFQRPDPDVKQLKLF
jgi:predicted PurR-regulated permease PerM